MIKHLTQIVGEGEGNKSVGQMGVGVRWWGWRPELAALEQPETDSGLCAALRFQLIRGMSELHEVTRTEERYVHQTDVWALSTSATSLRKVFNEDVKQRGKDRRLHHAGAACRHLGMLLTKTCRRNHTPYSTDCSSSRIASLIRELNCVGCDVRNSINAIVLV